MLHLLRLCTSTSPHDTDADSSSRALVAYRWPWMGAGALNLKITVPIDAAAAISHSTGIPDERIRHVRLPSSNSQCRSFHIEQVIGGSDTGSVLWSGSVVLSALLSSKGAELGMASASVIELGTGLGLVSVVLSCLGATVTATDGDEAILNMTRRNLLHNLEGSHGFVNVSHLWWGDEVAARSLGTFDFVVGSDVRSSAVQPPAQSFPRVAAIVTWLCTLQSLCTL